MRSSILSGVIAGAAFLLAVAIVAGVLAAKVLAAPVDAPAAEPAVPACAEEATVVDDMSAAGFALAAYLHGAEAVAYLEARGGQMPDGLTPADFSAVQVWAFMPDMARLILFDRGGCARLMATSSLRRELALLEAFKRSAI